MMKIFGKNPEAKDVMRSDHYRNGNFKNLAETRMMAKEVTVMSMLKEYFNPPHDRIPLSIIPSMKTNLYEPVSDKPVITWFGHSSYHISINGKNILVDPVLSGHASPFAFMIKAFKGTDIYKPVDFKKIDLLLLTHDHYDHLDYKALVQLKDNVKAVCCSMGVASHLTYWGYDKKIITELDWWKSAAFDGISITATPARHFSGRGLKRAQTLWSSFVMQSKEYQIFIGGDSGYGGHFTEIRKRFDGFDLAILECGQYNTKWPYIHMAPEETVQANADLNSKVLMPVHWGKFALAFHSWKEPANRVLAEAEKQNTTLAMPLIGAAFAIDQIPGISKWWENSPVL